MHMLSGLRNAFLYVVWEWDFYVWRVSDFLLLRNETNAYEMKKLIHMNVFSENKEKENEILKQWHM